MKQQVVIKQRGWKTGRGVCSRSCLRKQFLGRLENCSVPDPAEALGFQLPPLSLGCVPVCRQIHGLTEFRSDFTPLVPSASHSATTGIVTGGNEIALFPNIYFCRSKTSDNVAENLQFARNSACFWKWDEDKI